MATSQLSQVIEIIRRTTLARDESGMTDGQLLDQYVRSREEAAFAALVRRHGPMVWGVCRRLLGKHHDAEDAFQATFLVLVRKAASVVHREKVANWLYGVAHQTALKARATAVKRQKREKQVKAMPEPAAAQQNSWDDLQPVLDQELSQLPDKYRAVIVLCDLEGKTRKEADREFGLPEGTVATRLATARTMLAKRLARHGLVLSGGALATVLSQNVATAGMPFSVATSTIKAASMFATGQAAGKGLLSSKAVALTEGVLKTMLLSKLKTAIALLVAVGVLGVGTSAFTHQLLVGESRHETPPGQKGGDERTPMVTGIVRAVDADKNTVTVAYQDGTDTFNVAKDSHIVIDGKEGKLPALRAGALVTLSMFVDQKTARSLQGVGPQISGVVKSVDAEKNTVTFSTKDGDSTFTLVPDATIDIDGKPGKLAGMPMGALVTLSQFADQKTARSLQAQGSNIFATVKSVDALNNSITVVDALSVQKTFKVAGDAIIDIDGKSGKLAGLIKGASVAIILMTDQKTARSIRAQGVTIFRIVKAADAQQNTLTVVDALNAEKTYGVLQDTSIEIDGKPGKLSGVPGGATVNLTLFVDEKTARSIQAQGATLLRVVKAVDPLKNTITVRDAVDGEKTYTVAKDTAIEIDGQRAKLAAVRKGASVTLILFTDQQTARTIQAKGP